MKYTALFNESCLNRLSFIDLSPKELPYYLFEASLAKYGRNCNTFEGLPDMLCVFNKTKINLIVKYFNMIA